MHCPTGMTRCSSPTWRISSPRSTTSSCSGVPVRPCPRAGASCWWTSGPTRPTPTPPSLVPARASCAVAGWEHIGSSGIVDPSPARLAAFERRVDQQFEAAVLRRWHEELRPAVEAAYRRLQHVDLAALSDAALLAHL